MIDNINQLTGGADMTALASTNKITQWTVYDAKERKIYKLNHEEFKNVLLDNPHKLVGRTIGIRGEPVWIDCILHSENFK